jgi:PAS domain S-box-containing protein
VENRERPIFESKTACAPSAAPAVVQWNSQGLVMAWDEGAQRLFGRKAQDALGRNLSELFPSGAPFIDEDGRRLLFGECRPASFTSVAVHAPGEKTLINWSHAPVSDGNGKTICAVSVGRLLQEADAQPGRALQSETFILRIASRFAGRECTDEAVNLSLGELGALAQAGRARVFLLREKLTREPSPDGKRLLAVPVRLMENTHEWRAQGVAPQLPELHELPCENYPWLMEKLNAGEVLFYEDAAALPERATAARKIFEKRNVKSLLVLPFAQNGTTAGFIAIENLTLRAQSRDAALSLLGAASGIIGGALTHQRMVQALRIGEARYRYVYEKTPIGTELYDSHGYLLEINKASREMFGVVDLKDVVGLNLFVDPYVPKDAKERLDRYESLRYECNYDFEYVKQKKTYQTTKSGKRYTDILVTRLDPGFSSGEWGYMAQIEDVTERKLAEEAVRSERDFSTSLVQTSPAFFVTVDKDGNTMMMNESMLKALGYKLDEVVGKHYIRTFVPEDERKTLHGKTTRIMTSNQTGCVEHHIIAKDGRRLFVYWQGRPVMDDQGELKYAFNVGIDITERKMLEDQLRDAQKMEAVGRLAGGVAHEFNNLHCGILGYLEFILKREKMEEPLRKKIEMVHATALRASDITSRLLAASRKQSATKRPANLDEIVGDALCLMQSEFVKHNISVQTQLNAKNDFIMDGVQIYQVLMNILTNARDAMLGSQRRELTITTSMDEKHARLQISDTGGGISDANKPHIFEPFFTTKGAFAPPDRAGHAVGGTGLGLSICYTIIKEHDGTIDVQSKEGHGATFTITLPR